MVRAGGVGCHGRAALDQLRAERAAEHAIQCECGFDRSERFHDLAIGRDGDVIDELELARGLGAFGAALEQQQAPGHAELVACEKVLDGSCGRWSRMRLRCTRATADAGSRKRENDRRTDQSRHRYALERR